MDRLKQTDPLLMSAKALTIIVRFGLAAAVFVLVIFLGLLAAAALGWLPASFALDEASSFRDVPLANAAVAIILVLISIGLLYDFVVRLAQVIDTVAQGDPFILANAARLTRMAWLALGVQATSIAISLVGFWTEESMPDDAVQVESEVSFTGIVLVLVLFILARVFREGTRMRDELEGTV